MIKRLSRKYPLIFCILVLTIIMPLFYIISSKNPYTIGNNGYYLYTAIVELSAGLCTLIVIHIFDIRINFFNSKSRGTGFFKGLHLGSIMLFYCIGSFIIGMNSYGIENLAMPNTASIFSLLLMMISVGIFEELLCRGVLLNKLLTKWNTNGKGVYTAVIVSSAIFGSLHLINLFARPTLLFFTLAQVVYTTMAGTFFAAVYLRSKSIVSVIIYHALHDISTGIFYILIPTEKLATLNVHYAAGADQSVSQGLFLVFASLPLFIIALFLLRKVGDVQHGS